MYCSSVKAAQYVYCTEFKQHIGRENLMCTLGETKYLVNIAVMKS